MCLVARASLDLIMVTYLLADWVLLVKRLDVTLASDQDTYLSRINRRNFLKD